VGLSFLLGDKGESNGLWGPPLRDFFFLPLPLKQTLEETVLAKLYCNSVDFRSTMTGKGKSSKG